MEESEVFDYILNQENLYQTVPITVTEGYEWSMYEHCKRTLMYLNSRFESGDFGDRPFNNIILDKINLQHRAVDIDVVDVNIYVDNPEEYYKSFLTRKYHEKWAREIDLGEFLNDMTETWTDYGGVIVKNEYNGKPRVVPFNTVAFVDQTNMSKGPICEKHYFAPDELMEYAGVWNNLELTISLATQEHQQKEVQRTNQTIQTPTQYIEVYELHGMLPESYLDTENGDPFKFIRQMWVVAYYTDEKGDKCGITLYSGKESKSPYKTSVRDKIAGRALGRGGVEELFEQQLWVNYSEIQQKEMLDQASKIIYQTADPAFTTRNQTRNAKQGQVFVYEDNKPLSQINTNPVNVQLFQNKVEMWDNRAKTISASFDSISGEMSKSGTPFRLGLMQNQEAHSLHLYRKEKLGMFLQQIYRDWILPYFAKEMSKGDTFLAELSLDELQAVSEAVATQAHNEYVKEKLLNADIGDEEAIMKLSEELTPEKVAMASGVAKDNFIKGGNKKFIQVFRDEMKDLPLDIEVVITGESRNNAFVAEKLSAIFAQIAQNPAVLQDPLMRQLFNEILETSGVSPTQFATLIPKIADRTTPAPTEGQDPMAPAIPSALPQGITAQ
jgi:hypothetical protein